MASARAKATRWRWPPESCVGSRFFVASELDGLEQAQHAALDLRVRRALAGLHHAEAKGNVLEHAHVVEERVVLKNEAGVALVGAELGDIRAVEEHAAGAVVGKFEAGDRAQERRLSRAAGPEQRDEFAGLDLQAHVVERGIARIFLGDVADFDAHRGRVTSVARAASASCRSARHSAKVFRISVSSASTESTDATANAAEYL